MKPVKQEKPYKFNDREVAEALGELTTDDFRSEKPLIMRLLRRNRR